MNLLSLLAFILVIGVGCKKNGSTPSGFTGTWELRVSSGTIAGVTKTYQPGNGSLIQFNADNTYKFFITFRESNHGTYRIVKNGITMGSQTYDALYYDNSPSADFVVLDADSLTIGNTYPDGVTSSYLRQK